MIDSLTKTVIVVFAIIGVIFAVAVIVLNGCAPATYIKDAPPALRPETIPAPSDRDSPGAVILTSGAWRDPNLPNCDTGRTVR